MLTPDRIKNKTFQTTGKGSYRAEEVDSFMEEVSASYEQVFRENGEIIKKMSILANKVEEYKKDEDSLRQALLSAQKLADQITAEANEKAEKAVSEANAEAQRILDEAKQKAEKLENDAKTSADEKVFTASKEANDILGGVNRKVTQEKLVLEMLQREVGAFKNKMMDMYKEHLTLLDRLPQIAAEETDEDATEAAAKEETKEEPVNSVEEAVTEDEASDDIDDIFELEELDDAEEDGFVYTDESDGLADEEDEDIMTYEPAVPEKQEAVDDGFSFDSTVLDDDDEFEDITSGAEDEGFSLDLDDVDLEDDEEETADSKAAGYASADVEPDNEDDDDDNGAISFKRFFKKK